MTVAKAQVPPVTVKASAIIAAQVCQVFFIGGFPSVVAVAIYVECSRYNAYGQFRKLLRLV